MENETTISRMDQVVRGRNLLILAVVDVVLFIVANVTYGTTRSHSLRNSVSNPAWVVFLVGFVLLVVVGIVSLTQVIRRRAKAQA
jgi:uncharacterized membrane protein